MYPFYPPIINMALTPQDSRCLRHNYHSLSGIAHNNGSAADESAIQALSFRIVLMFKNTKA